MEVYVEASPTTNIKRQERTAFLLLAVVLFPVLAVMIVASYGFAVWFWQMFISGPPGG
jgi:nitrate reductase NapE